MDLARSSTIPNVSSIALAALAADLAIPPAELQNSAIDSLLSRSPNVCGGRVRIDGTRVTVLQIVTCYQQGLTPEEIADQYPHVNLAQIYAALTYYHANRDEIDRELEAEAAEFDRLANEFAKPQE